MTNAEISQYEKFRLEIIKTEQADPELRGHKECMRVAAHWVRHSNGDEQKKAIAAEIEANYALNEYITQPSQSK